MPQARLGARGSAISGCRTIAMFTDRYDRIASIEMLEAVGERYWPIYFHKLRQSLTDTGVARAPGHHHRRGAVRRYRRQPDFIQRYIFPGGMLPTVEIDPAGGRASGASARGARRLRARAMPARSRNGAALPAAGPRSSALGFDARFKRMWEYYLAYCEVGFDLGAIDVGLFKLVPAQQR